MKTPTTPIRTIARVVVTLYVLMTAAVLCLVGFVLMALPFVSLHYHQMQISDLHVYYMGLVLFLTGATFLYGITDEHEQAEVWEEAPTLAPAVATA